MCFRCRRNVGIDGELRIIAGNKFHIFGAEIRNASEPNSRLCHGTERELRRRGRWWSPCGFIMLSPCGFIMLRRESLGSVGSCLQVFHVAFSRFPGFSLVLDPRSRQRGLGGNVECLWQFEDNKGGVIGSMFLRVLVPAYLGCPG